MTLRTRILLIEDDAVLRRSVQGLLEDEGYEVELAASAAEGLELLGKDAAVAAVISEVPDDVDPAYVLERIRRARPDLPVLWMGAKRRTREPGEGVWPTTEFVALPLDPEDLRHRVRRVITPARKRDDLTQRSPSDDPYDLLVGDTPVMAGVREALARVATVDSTVLILGETGTGKDLAARLIHRCSGRRDRPFVTINCGAPEEFLEEELFGHERATLEVRSASSHGRLERADGGTVFFDEIGDLPLSLQARVLRFLRDRCVPRAGGTRERLVDVRVIAATQRNLPEAIVSGEFRSDLFFRLAAVPIELPPLRAHREDVPALCRHLVAKLARRLGRPVMELADSTIDALTHHPFPGNVRELENLLERALVLGSGDESRRQLEIADLPEYGVSAQPFSSASMPLEGGFARLGELQTGMERDLILRAIRRWPELSNTQIARRLGTNRRILELRMKEHGISKRARSHVPRR
jgi:DNA-binding NtrC family response regulator